jgi:cell division protein FtsW
VTALSLRHPAVLLGLTCGALVLLGLVMILSASHVESFERYGSSFMIFKRQLLWAVVGVIAYLVCARIDYRRWRGAGYIGFPIVAALLVAVLIPGIGVSAGGSARWLALGPVTFQPSEAAKLVLVLLLADVFARKDERLLQEPAHTYLPALPLLGLLALLVMLQPDMGTTILLAAIVFGMMFVAGAPLRYLVPAGTLGATFAAVVALVADYRRARILAFMDPWADPLKTGYHTIQSLIALGSGGWFGVGLGASRQKWSYIPNAHTDFIFSILGEETGLIGTLTVLALFVFLAYLGVRAARRAPDRFGMMIASGVTIWVSTQALVNIGAVSATLPVTGVPLPLVSFGGTSLVILLASLGIVTNIARHERPARRRRR